uniref:Uncharacterized protein n=1 Tax=Rousettus bat poxvirus TaxID=3141933 RepID=A0AAU7E2D3_9POXV
MEKLYAGVFGVFMSSGDEEFEEFLTVVGSALVDKPHARAERARGGGWLTWVVLGVVGVVVALLYLKLAAKK